MHLRNRLDSRNRRPQEFRCRSNLCCVGLQLQQSRDHLQVVLNAVMRLLDEQLQEMVLVAEILQQLRVVNGHPGPAGKRLHKFEVRRRKLRRVRPVPCQAQGTNEFVAGNQGHNQGGPNIRFAEHWTISMLHDFLTGEDPPLTLRPNLPEETERRRIPHTNELREVCAGRYDLHTFLRSVVV